MTYGFGGRHGGGGNGSGGNGSGGNGRAGSAALVAACCAGLLAAQDGRQQLPAGAEVHETASGLRWCVLDAGIGTRHPKADETVVVHYTCWLEDGRQVFSSRDRGEPERLALDKVVDGFAAGLQLMVEGARFKLVVPPELGYGEAGSPPEIPPDSTVIYDVELLALPPEFRRLDENAAARTESGLRYQIVREGQGERPTAGDVLELDYAVWTPAGRLLDTSFRRGARITGKLEHMKLPFLKEIPLLLRRNGRCLVEVPNALGFGDDVPAPFGDLGPDGVTIWEIELSSVHEPLPTPAFAMPAEDELARTPRGLAYQVLREGEGEPPSPWQMVTVHYAGWQADGTLFDSSYQRGVPLATRLDGVILGWHLGLQLMKPGAVYKFVFPPELAYGKRGDPNGRIGPDETLLFQVELLRVGR